MAFFYQNTTEIEELYEQFLEAINDYTYLEYTDEELATEFNRKLKSALGRFKSCDKLKDVDLESGELNCYLDYDEMEITVQFMVLSWLDRQVNDITKFKQRLSSKDYQTFSNANLLDKIQQVRKNKSNEIDKLVAEYSMNKLLKTMKEMTK